MGKITVVWLFLLFICLSLPVAGFPDTGTSAKLPAAGSTTLTTTDNSAKASSVAAGNSGGKSTGIANNIPNSGQQATQLNSSPTTLPPAQNTPSKQNISPNKPGLPAPVPASPPKALLPSGTVMPPDPQPVKSATPHRAGFASYGRVSLNFDDADIYSVIQTVFGEILKVNYIIDSRVKGRVTFRSVSPVAMEKVLPLMEVILKLNGASIIVDSELYRIVPTELKDKRGIRVFLYHVQNAKAKDIANMLQQLYLGAKSQATDKSSMSSPEPASSSAQSTKAVVAGNRQSGIEGILSDDVKIFADEKLNAVVVLGTREDFDIIKQTISELDIVPRQVLIEGTIASIQLTDKMSLGLAWSIKTNFSVFGLDKLHISFNPSDLVVNPTAPTADGLNIIGVDSSATVKAVINALASDSKAKLMAAPHIMVSDNSEARIQVGQQVPIVTSETYNSTTTTSPVRTIQYKDIGIILKVKPQINDSGLISLQIAQEVSTYSTIKLYSNEDQIILNKTEATTNLVVKNGQTIVIGGLIREDDSKAREGIPWLLKIPILGYLFGNTTKENNRTELVILLTPYIVKDQQDVAEVTNKYADKITDKYIGKELKQSIHQEKNEQKEKAVKK
ncbi:MAG: secretin N-terminal domain-containing protein [Smithella sp.]